MPECGQGPLVGIVLGSASDRSLGQDIVTILNSFKVPYELVVASAHRTPDKAATFAMEAANKGLKVIIAVAGLAAHLPGVLAAKTILPVIGVPAGGGTLGGLDALFSVIQMPSGIPVAGVGINNAKNAALLAIAILALSDERLATDLRTYRDNMAATVELGEQEVLQGLIKR